MLQEKGTFDHDSTSTSHVQIPENNTGESRVQGGGEEIVNEQEQNKSVNQEEFIDDVAANTNFYEAEKSGLAKSGNDGYNNAVNDKRDPEALDDVSEKDEKKAEPED